MAHKAPCKAKLLLEDQRLAAPPATSQGNVVSKSKAASTAIFEASGGLNEAIEVVAHMLQRQEMRPIIEHLGYSQTVVRPTIDARSGVADDGHIHD